MENLKIDNDFVEIWVEDEIIYCIYKPNVILNLQTAQLLVKERLKISEGIEYLFFININNLVSVDLGARRYLASSDATKFVKAGAIYCENPIAKFLGKLF